MSVFLILLGLCLIGGAVGLAGLAAGFFNFAEPFWARVAAIGFIVFALCGGALCLVGVSPG